MDKSEEGRRYKWSNSATNLLVSIWCHDLVQNQLKISTRNQPIWESIARYMSRKGFSVSGVQCRTRIKNMLCTYHEAVRKNDPNGMEPYFDIFKRVLKNKSSKKKGVKSSKVRPSRYSEETEDENEISLDSDSFEVSQSISQNPSDSEYQVQFLDLSNQESQASTLLNSNELLKDLEKVIVDAVDSQTKAITNAIKLQSQMIERFLATERERLETILASERESRRQLETRLDRLISRFETNSLSQLTYMGTIIETRQNE